MNTLLMSVSVFLDNAQDNTVYIKGIESGGGLLSWSSFSHQGTQQKKLHPFALLSFYFQ